MQNPTKIIVTLPANIDPAVALARLGARFDGIELDVRRGDQDELCTIDVDFDERFAQQPWAVAGVVARDVVRTVMGKL